VIENTGSGKLYTLTVMTPNEGFAELIRAGQPVDLDEEDLKVLGVGKGDADTRRLAGPRQPI
jgi:hypothetical protein